MHTLDGQGGASASWWARRWRDARLIGRIVRMTFGYIVRGGLVRRRFRAAERRGETYWVDRHHGQR